MLQRRTFFQGRPIRGEGVTDMSWFNPDGSEMTDEEWEPAATSASACGWPAT